MAKTFLTSIDLVGNELMNASIHNLAKAPDLPKVGQIYFNTGSNIPMFWNGTEWTMFGHTTAEINTIVRGTKLAGYSLGVNSALVAGDTVLGAFGKIQGQLNAKQASDADLSAIAALTGTSGFLKKTAANTWTLDTNTYLLSTDNAVSATKLKTARDFSITGGATAGVVSFNGENDVELKVTELDASKLKDTTTIPSGVLARSSLYVGTTKIALNRASATLNLTGIGSIGATSLTATGAVSAKTITAVDTISTKAITGTVSVTTPSLIVSNSVQIGSAVLKYDTTNNAIYVEKADGSAVNFYSTGESAAYGVGSGLPTGGGGGVTALSLLTDVSLATPATGNVLIYNGTHWENKPQSAIVPNLSPYALKTYVDSKVAGLVDSAPEALDTLVELAAALGNDENFATTVANEIGTKEDKITAGITAQYWRGDKTWQTLTTTAIAEGTKLFYTDARVRTYADSNYVKLTSTIGIDKGGTGATTASGALTNLGGTTVGVNLFKLTNPSAITFLRVNANNTVTALNAAAFRTAIGAGTSSTAGTVTSVGGTGSVNGITLSGSITTSGNLTLGGTLSGINIVDQTTGTLTTARGGTGFTDAKNGIARKVVGTFTTNATSYAITHSLGGDVIAQVIDIATKEVVEVDIIQTSTTEVTFNFNVAPGANKYKYVIIG